MGESGLPLAARLCAGCPEDNWIPASARSSRCENCRKQHRKTKQQAYSANYRKRQAAETGRQVASAPRVTVPSRTNRGWDVGTDTVELRVEDLRVVAIKLMEMAAQLERWSDLYGMDE